MGIPAIDDKFGQLIIYGLLCTVGASRPISANSLLTLQDIVWLFVHWLHRVQSLVPPTGEISWSNMEHFLTPPRLVPAFARNLSILRERSP
jgi:hypothetical protein